MPPTFAQLLRRYRVAMGLTQEQLAGLAGLSTRAVSDLERGVNTRPHQSTVELLTEALGLAVEEDIRLREAVPRHYGPSSEPVLSRSLLAGEHGHLIGREREEAEAVYLVRWVGARLLTLMGVGGVGKTRLALHIAASLLDDFPDGVVVATLASLRDHRLVLPAVARALGLREGGKRPLMESVVAYLRGKEILLVLDNFEQVLDAAAMVEDLLSACPKLAVLVTSRTPLHVRGEHEMEVPPLAVPDATGNVPLAHLKRYPAVSLFRARALAAKPDMESTRSEMTAIAQICLRLEGISLAIELAAAQVQALSLPELLSRLDHRLPVLVGGSRDVPARQQTMRDTIAWSYDLLPESEKRLFRCLATFAGGFDLAAAEAVCDGEVQGDVLDGLASLAQRNLLTVDSHDSEAGYSESRFHMLETIREYGIERLETSCEGGPATLRHADYFLGLVEEAEPALHGPEQADWLHRLQNENDNLRAALAWFSGHGDPSRV